MYKIFVKRMLDIIFCITLLPFLLLLTLIVGTLIFIEDRGTIFYIAPRLGKNGELFNMYKYRSMKVDAPDIRNTDGSTFNSHNDPRLTKIGSFLRRSSIDEIPQVINVLKGDMSFIGPRPGLPEAYEMYSDYEKKKLSVRPGISGYNQAFFRNSITQKEKIINDIFYIDNISFKLDIKIVLYTVLSIFLQKNIYSSNSRKKFKR